MAYHFPMENVTFFGSPLVKFKVDQKMVELLNFIADQILEKDQVPSDYDFKDRLSSAVSRERKFPDHMAEEFRSYVINLGEKFHKQYYANPFQDSKNMVKLSSMWVVSQRETEWNYLHSHNDSISGIVYLKVPANMAVGLSADDKRARMPGSIAFTEGPMGNYRNSVKTFTPKVGDLYLFPSDLLHTVYPFFGGEERRSLSFNLSVT